MASLPVHLQPSSPSLCASHSPCSAPDMAAYKFAPPSHHVSHRDQLQYSLAMVQQPLRARMVGSGEKADRRPIDPPPIVGFQLIDRSQAGSPVDFTLLRSPAFICYATLCEPSGPFRELFTMPHSRKPYMVGTRVSSIFQMREDYQAVGQGHYFLFPDLGVRVEGQYRLKLSVYEIVQAKVHFCASILTDQFEVFSAKKFPGMKESTPLSKTFAKQGIRLRIRKKSATPTNKRLQNLSEAYLVQAPPEPYLVQAPPEAYLASAENPSEPPPASGMIGSQKRRKLDTPLRPMVYPHSLHPAPSPSQSIPSPSRCLPSVADMLKGVPPPNHQRYTPTHHHPPRPLLPPSHLHPSSPNQKHYPNS